MKRFILSSGCAAVLLAGRLLAQGGGDAAKGKDVFEQCGVCHNVDTDEKKIGPSLKGLYKRGKLKNGKPVNDENVLHRLTTAAMGCLRTRICCRAGKKDVIGLSADGLIGARGWRRVKLEVDACPTVPIV